MYSHLPMYYSHGIKVFFVVLDDCVVFFHWYIAMYNKKLSANLLCCEYKNTYY